MKKYIANNSIQIPIISRDGSLVSRLIPVILVGADKTLDKESKLYICLLVRLIDKAFSEYMNAREYIKEELETGDKLANRFTIIGHLENCINAISRVSKIFNLLINGKMINNDCKKIIKKDYNIVNLLSSESRKKIKDHSVSHIRNRIEHIDEDIYFNYFKSELSLDVDNDYKSICINKKCVQLSNLVLMIEDYHKFILEIISNLPNRNQK